MESKPSSADYYPATEAALESVSDEKLSLATVIKNLQGDIINSFNGDGFSMYKRG